MEKNQELTLRIEELRKSLNDLILKRDNLTHLDVIRTSRLLDDALNQYNHSISSKR